MTPTELKEKIVEMLYSEQFQKNNDKLVEIMRGSEATREKLLDLCNFFYSHGENTIDFILKELD